MNKRVRGMLRRKGRMPVYYIIEGQRGPGELPWPAVEYKEMPLEVALDRYLASHPTCLSVAVEIFRTSAGWTRSKIYLVGD